MSNFLYTEKLIPAPGNSASPGAYLLWDIQVRKDMGWRMQWRVIHPTPRARSIGPYAHGIASLALPRDSPTILERRYRG